MQTMNLRDLIERTEAKKAMLGIGQTPAEVEALRNKGAGRSPEKRELLRRVADRAKNAGQTPPIAYW